MVRSEWVHFTESANYRHCDCNPTLYSTPSRAPWQKGALTARASPLRRAPAAHPSSMVSLLHLPHQRPLVGVLLDRARLVCEGLFVKRGRLVLEALLLVLARGQARGRGLLDFGLPLLGLGLGLLRRLLELGAEVGGRGAKPGARVGGRGAKPGQGALGQLDQLVVPEEAEEGHQHGDQHQELRQAHAPLLADPPGEGLDLEGGHGGCLRRLRVHGRQPLRLAPPIPAVGGGRAVSAAGWADVRLVIRAVPARALHGPAAALLAGVPAVGGLGELHRLLARCNGAGGARGSHGD
mmetsp:Transcript_34205/g.101602  ORF Transcript_34205/g.101602 Transcript_34205/m.101602 type:complete len:294 (+) Transcript_34205:63-944(+)